MRSFLPAVGWRSLRSGDVDTLGGRITGLPTPVEDSEAATKEYVDDSAGDNGGSQPAQFKQQISFQRTPPSVITIPDSTWTALDFTDAIILQHGNPNPISADVSDGMLTLPKETANVWSVFSIVEFVQNNGGGVRACDLLYQQGVLGDDIAGGVTPAIHDALVNEEGGFYVVATWVQDPDNDLVFAPTVYQDSGGDLNVLNWKFSFQVIG